MAKGRSAQAHHAEVVPQILHEVLQVVFVGLPHPHAMRVERDRVRFPLEPYLG